VPQQVQDVVSGKREEENNFLLRVVVKYVAHLVG
jgi:hypothetical protein